MGSRCSGTGSGKVHTTQRALALPKGAQPCLMATRWIPPERSVFQLVFGPATASIALRSSSVRSLSQPSFWRSEEHTSELQSLMRISYAVFCLKKKTIYANTSQRHIEHTNH